MPVKKILKILIGVAVLAVGFAFVQTVLAQDFGVNEVGNEIALPSQDPRVFAANIIRVALGFLGIIAVAIVLYGGFVWMTSGGNEERLSKAKKILTSGIIGLIIIIMAFGITSFVISRLMEATGMAPGGGGPGGGGGGGGGGLPSDAFTVRSIQPSSPIPIRNVVVRVVFNKNVEEASLAGNLTVKKTSDSSAVTGTIRVSGSVAEFTPSAACPDPNADRFCFDADTEFTVEVTTSARSTDGKNLICGGLAPSCRVNFTTGNLVDTAGPTIEITYPDAGQSVPADDLVNVQARVTDDAGISYIEYFADGNGAPWDPNNIDTPTGLVTTYDSSNFWDTAGLTLLSRHTLTSKAYDIDTNNTTSGGVEVLVRAAHCFNGAQDADETGVDCGGTDCGTCDGGSCTTGSECRSGVCLGGVCRTLPIIIGVTPADGAVGNYITIYGEGFGTTPGNVYFTDNVSAPFPACGAASTWQNNQIIVEVPSGAADGPIKVVVPPPSGATAADYTDMTNDERGPILPNFDVNDTRRPGICAIDPTSGEPRSGVTISGKGFGSRTAGDEVIFSGTRALSTGAWDDDSIEATVPPLAAQTARVQVVKGGENSNPVDFQVTALAAAPQILRFEPVAGPIGEYVTIFGANFGDEIGTVNFKDAGGADILFVPNFPEACGDGWWKNDQIIVKVPTGAATGIIKVTTQAGDSDDTSDLTPRNFTVNTDPLKPGLCKIEPDNGPTAASVTLYGERFGSSGTAKFWNDITATVASGNWRDTEITTSVPTGAATGPVTVTVGTNVSNGINFTIRDCRTSTPQCLISGQTCCRSGACSSACEVAPGQGYYFWQFSTGQLPIYPEVVEDCDNPSRTMPPPLRTPPSPSPWDSRTEGDNACTNVNIAARFTTPIDEDTLDSDTIIVEKCTAITGDDPCATTTRVAFPPGSLTTNSNAQGMFEFAPGSLDPSTTYRVTLKGGPADDDTVPAIRSADGFRLDGDRDGEQGGDYVWKFRTRESTTPCAIGWIGIFPYEKTLSEEFAKQKYSGLCLAAEDSCSLVNCSRYAWAWSSLFPTGGDASTKAQVRGNSTLNPPIPPGTEVSTTDGNKAVAEAREETAVGVPVRVTGAIPSQSKSGFSELTVNFADPRVVEKWPDCSDACTNAALGARFNTRMKNNSVDGVSLSDPANIENPDNVSLYVWQCGNGVIEIGEDCDDGNTYNDDGCGTNCLNGGESACTWGNAVDCNKDSRCVWSGTSCTQRTVCGNGRRETGEDCDGVPFPDLTCSATTCLNLGTSPSCGNGRVEEGEDCDDGGTISGDGCSSNCLNEGSTGLREVGIRELRYDFAEGVPANKTNILNITPAAAFLPNTFYKVVISGSVTSKSGVRLTELNHPSATSPTAYAWSFKTKDDATPCAVDRVTVDPETAVLTWVGATQDYLSTPFSAPDVCSSTGQRLGAMDYDWDWSSADTNVATVTDDNNNPACGNGVLEWGEDCDDGNTDGPDGCDTDCLSGGESACTWGNAIDCNKDKRCTWRTTSTTCVKTTVCGNSIREIGEDCDDGNRLSGDGCNNLCIHEGSVAGGSVCGNGRKERGEDCDDGNTEGGDGCRGCPEGVTSCPGSCLNEGTVEDIYDDPYQIATAEGLKEADVAAGRKQSTTEIKAQEIESAVEGAGDLTVRCDFGWQEDSSEYRNCQPESLVCDPSGICHGSTKTCSSSSDCELGVGRDTCCHFKPKVKSCDPSGTIGSCSSRPVPPDSNKVCRNAQLSAVFDQALDPASLTGNVLVLANYDVSVPCPEGSTPLPGARTTAMGEGSHFAKKIENLLPGRIGKFLAARFLKIENYFVGLRSFVNKISQVFLGKEVLAQTPPLPRINPWCVWPGKVTSLTLDPETDAAKTKVIFSPTKAFESDKTYRVAILGDDMTPGEVTKGITSLKGAALGGTVGSTTIDSTLRFDGDERQIYSWTFRTGADICVINRVELEPGFKLFKKNEEKEGFEILVTDWRGNQIAPLDGVYSWVYENWLSTDTSIVTLAAAGRCRGGSGTFCSSDAECAPETCEMETSLREATAQNKNGDARILATVRVTTDVISRPGMLGRRFEAGADVTVFLCEEPWPADIADSEGWTDGDYNFRTFYCKDKGDFGTDDDFPALLEPGEIVQNNYPVPGPADKDDLFREYFLFINGKYCTLSKNICENSEECGATGGSCQPSSDVIGVRIYENKDHLNLADWYQAQGFRHAAPAAKTIDGYEAIQDGRTIYISAANKWDLHSLYTNVYLISYNDGAHPDTLEIYNQLVGNLKFNINLNNDKICKTIPTSPGELPTSVVGTDGQPKQCSSDFDCLISETQYICAAPKDKLSRDMKRIIDLEKMRRAISAKAIPPKLEAGTYVRGMSASVWDSWTNVLGKEVGALPTDPLNKINGCGDAKLCDNNLTLSCAARDCPAGDGTCKTYEFDANTCWSVDSQIYRCPEGSHIYQYRFNTATGRYEIGTDFEYTEDTGGDSGVGWSNIPGLSSGTIKIKNVCSATAIYQNAGICGDGAIGADNPATPLDESEECEPGMVNVCSLNTGKSCAADTDCGAGEGTCLKNEQNCLTTDDPTTPINESKPGRQSRNCNLATCQWNGWGACSTNCGNGIIDSGEECDRGPGGGRIPGGGTGAEFIVGGRTVRNEYNCSETCQVEDGYCGDRILQPGYGERCDDGTLNGSYGKRCSRDVRRVCSSDLDCSGLGECRTICAIGCVGAAPYCGDRTVDADASAREQCDGNTETKKGFCYSGLAIDRDNDEVMMPGCDSDADCDMGSCYNSADPAASSGRSCRRLTDCPSGETCDEPYFCDFCSDSGVGYPRSRTRNCLPPGDSAQCRWPVWGACEAAGSCGNGIKDGTEECDDGNTSNNDSCTNICRTAVCGDGYVKTGVEVCDAGSANGTVCSASYGSTCNYCSRECTLRTATGPTCGDGVINGSEQCEPGVSLGQKWICVDYNNPWFRLTPPPPVVAPSCPVGVCQITCASGRACDNTINRDASDRPTNDADNDGVSDACDPNDDSDVDGCLDGEAGCVNVGMVISAVIPPGETEPDDTFRVYLDGHYIGQAGRTVVLETCHFTLDGEIDCSYIVKTITINGLRRGLHNIRIVYSSSKKGVPVFGQYQIIHNPYPLVDWGLDSNVFISENRGPNPAFTVLFGEAARDFEVQ